MSDRIWTNSFEQFWMASRVLATVTMSKLCQLTREKPTEVNQEYLLHLDRLRQAIRERERTRPAA